MNINKYRIGQVLRWIFFIPLSVTMYIVSKLCLSWTFLFISSKILEDLTSFSDFGGHYILGPIFIFIIESFSVGFAIYSGVYLAPKSKKLIFFSYLILWILFLLLVSFIAGLTYFSMDWTLEKLFRNLTEIIAQLAGFIVSGLFIWRELKKNKTQSITNLEQINQ